MFKFLIILILIYLTESNNNDMHSSIPALEKILLTESIMLKKFEKLLNDNFEKINKLKSYLKDLENLSQQSEKINGTHSPLRNLIHINDLNNLRDNVKNSILEINETELKDFSKFELEYPYPTNDDLEGATVAILRLQVFYDLTADDIVNMTFIEKKSNRLRLSASDCFQVGFNLQAFNEYKFSSEWFEESLKRIEYEQSLFKLPVSKEVVLDFLSYTKWKEGGTENLRLAIKYAKESLALNPDNHKITKNLIKYEQDYKISLTSKKPTEKPNLTYDPNIEAEIKINRFERKQLKIGCQGKFVKSAKEQKYLHCKYENVQNSFLTLAPFKIEILNLDPYIAKVYDIIYDNEILTIKDLTEDQLTRAVTWNSETGEGIKTYFRTSEFTWLNNNSDPIIHKLNQRVADITGLMIQNGEDYQVLNYGIGGHYDIHADPLLEPDESGTIVPYGQYELGNRIATVLFYMSNVEKGGATVFPHLNVASFPKKGSALFWYNLLSDGNVDFRSRHAACPVIYGSKWVSNKWIRVNDQMFRKPCKLNSDIHKSEDLILNILTSN